MRTNMQIERITKLSAAVRLEMIEMRRCGMRVPAAALLAAQDAATIVEYENMSAGEIAELLIELA